MKLVVFGATGGTGTKVVERALSAGHDVVAVARRPEAVPPRDRLVIVQCDVLEAPAVVAAMSGGDAVIATIGPASNRKPGTLISAGVHNLLAGCVAGGINRFVFESGIMVGDGRELSTTGRLAVKMAAFVNSALKAEKVVAEASITASPLDWVIVRPPILKDTPATGDCVAAPRARISPAKSISYADCAGALVTAATESQWVGQVVNVGRP
jgi:putative NADH-flavin reductase